MAGKNQSHAGSNALPDGFVFLRDVAPSIVQDIRYATPRNFTGKPVPGYEAAECVLKRAAAEALKRAQEKAQPLGYSLKVYDCYRPVRAVRAFLAWAGAPEDGSTKAYYPHLSKSQLMPAYIAPQSTHSTGFAVDLTLIPVDQTAEDRAEDTKDCTAPFGNRVAGVGLDMGTSFDCFDQKANTASPLATPKQHADRAILQGILESAGFKNYSEEWWHYVFTVNEERQRYDFVIKR